MSLTNSIRQKAYQIGFDLCGFTSDFQPHNKEYFLDWLKEQKYAEMNWLNRNVDKRLQPDSLMQDTQSVIVLAVNYAHEPKEKDFKLARYAHGKDYHIWMKQKLEKLSQSIHDTISLDFKWRTFVDTGPVLERDLAQKAGIGWVGKNTNLMQKEEGSYLFLGVIFNNLKLVADKPAVDQCANCKLCLDACPTQALEPYQLDARKCLAYHNIEKKGEREKNYWQALDHHLIGCDICQEVCPWNHDVSLTKQKDWLRTFSEFDLGSLKDILQMTATEYKNKTRHSAISRVRYKDFMRNVFLVLANTKRNDLKDDVLKWQNRYPELNFSELNWYLQKVS